MTLRTVHDKQADDFIVRQWIGTASFIDLRRFCTEGEADAYCLGFKEAKSDLGRTWEDDQDLNEAYDLGRYDAKDATTR